MKKASRILYTIGLVFNIIAIVGIAIWMIVALVGMLNAEEAFKAQTDVQDFEEFKAALLVLFIVPIVLLVVEIVVLIIAIWARKAVNNNKKELAPHIIMIVIGAISTDILYLLGGIFGVVGESQQ